MRFEIWGEKKKHVDLWRYREDSVQVQVTAGGICLQPASCGCGHNLATKTPLQHATVTRARVHVPCPRACPVPVCVSRARVRVCMHAHDRSTLQNEAETVCAAQTCIHQPSARALHSRFSVLLILLLICRNSLHITDHAVRLWSR